jgi:hypothetical protein
MYKALGFSPNTGRKEKRKKERLIMLEQALRPVGKNKIHPGENYSDEKYRQGLCFLHYYCSSISVISMNKELYRVLRESL